MRHLERFENLVVMFFARAKEKGDSPFLWAKKQGTWQSMSWREAAEKVAGLAAALRSFGLERGDRVMLVGENRPEWLISDLAIMAAGCVTVPTYTTNTERDHQHILDDSGARAVIVATQKLAKTLLPAAIRSNSCEAVIGMEPLPAGQALSVAVHDWNALVAAQKADVEACAAAAADFRRSELACIIYTSGTGGAPPETMALIRPPNLAATFGRSVRFRKKSIGLSQSGTRPVAALAPMFWLRRIR